MQGCLNGEKLWQAKPELLFLVGVLTITPNWTKLKFKKEYHMAKGTIRRLIDRGFGFIQTAEGTDLFFHHNELEGVEFNSLSEGQEVEFEKSQGRDGRPQAVKVRLAEAEVKEEPPSAEETTEAPEAAEEGSTEAT
jgi:CspA family cold shock protein